MSLQIIQGENGTPTGVFIPISDWELMKQEYQNLQAWEEPEPTKAEILAGIKEAYKVIPTHNFDRELKRLTKKYRHIKANVYELGERLEENPTWGDQVIKNCYKIRMAISNKGKGKSGGARIITYVYVVQETVFLLSIYDKGEREDISNQELKTLIESLDLEE
ncbi:hypothetical protein CHS0354_024124 [Potamilus streckersoni]|uniref:Addiction module toxin RelE n=1 Tax=Potamilus streckersoni TaxID=2493646 RepID=A0AAE0VMX1_9BIVA|nr:hypothetical protein CHS0354_024124 [Potamilus streckersoni]